MSDDKKSKSDWKGLHDCNNVLLGAFSGGQCAYCVANELELNPHGYEVVPIDVPGTYDFTRAPYVIVRKLDGTKVKECTLEPGHFDSDFKRLMREVFEKPN